MSLRCNIDMCKRKCCVLCYCCKKNLCLNHLKEHRDAIEIQFNSLVNEINDQIMKFDTEILVKQFSDKLNERIDYLKNVINRLRLTISELMSEQDSTNEDIILLRLNIGYIKQEIERIKQNFRLLIIERIIPIEQSLNLSSTFQMIVCQHSVGSALATNNQQLLMDQRLSLHLFNQDFILIKQYQWKKDFIRNICWSIRLKKFIFITNNKQIYLNKIGCLAHVQISLFLTTGTQIFEFNLSTKFELIQQWISPYSCQKHEFIRDIVYNNQTLALIIEDSLSNLVHLELRSSETLDRLWSFRSDIQYHLFQPAIQCCSLKYGEWLVIDSNNSRLIHIDKNGQMKGLHVYKSPPWNAILYGHNTLAIRTENTLNFHRIY